MDVTMPAENRTMAKISARSGGRVIDFTQYMAGRAATGASGVTGPRTTSVAGTPMAGPRLTPGAVAHRERMLRHLERVAERG